MLACLLQALLTYPWRLAPSRLSYPSRIRRELSASLAIMASDTQPTHANGPLLGLDAELQAEYQLEGLLKAAENDQGSVQASSSPPLCLLNYSFSFVTSVDRESRSFMT